MQSRAKVVIVGGGMMGLGLRITWLKRTGKTLY